MNPLWRFLPEHSCDPAKPTIYAQSFTSSPKKNWPLEKCLALAQHWRERGVQVIFGGGPLDRPVLESALHAGFPVPAGVPLLTSAGLMKLSTLVVGGDTGALHLATAMGKRVVMVMHSTRPGSIYPFGHADWAVKPQKSDMVVCIEVGAVLQASVRAFSEVGASLPRTQFAFSTSHNPPEYCTSPAPFRELFERGNPPLTRHKLGPRPPGARETSPGTRSCSKTSSTWRRSMSVIPAAIGTNACATWSSR